MAEDEREREVNQAEASLLGQLGELLDRIELLLVLGQREVVPRRDAIGAVASRLGALPVPPR